MTGKGRVLEIPEREAYRVKLFMDLIDQSEKGLVFCATQEHALAVRDLINQMKKKRLRPQLLRSAAFTASQQPRKRVGKKLTALRKGFTSLRR